jgi:hypothetical protein
MMTTQLSVIVARLVFVVLAFRNTEQCAVVALSPASLISNTKWKLRLDVGLQPGTWMPKRFPGWGASGARLPVDVDIEFLTRPSPRRESLVGPKAETFVLQVSGDAPSTVVSERGQEEVVFADGGWCVQRPTAAVRNAEGGTVAPPGLLRFWLDCPSGARKRDAEIFPGTRIYFTTGVWDAPEEVEERRAEYEGVVERLQGVVDATREIRREEEEGGEGGLLGRLGDFRTLVDNSKDFDRLAARKEALEQASPPRGSAEAANGVKIAPTGSLVVKGNNFPDWFPGSEYLILGTFSTKALD